MDSKLLMAEDLKFFSAAIQLVVLCFSRWGETSHLSESVISGENFASVGCSRNSFHLEVRHTPKGLFQRNIKQQSSQGERRVSENIFYVMKRSPSSQSKHTWQHVRFHLSIWMQSGWKCKENGAWKCIFHWLLSFNYEHHGFNSFAGLTEWWLSPVVLMRACWKLFESCWVEISSQ